MRDKNGSVLALMVVAFVSCGGSIQDAPQEQEMVFAGRPWRVWREQLGSAEENARTESLRAVVYLYHGLDRVGMVTLAPGWGVVLDAHRQRRVQPGYMGDTRVRAHG
jgi:hypothetical protein